MKDWRVWPAEWPAVHWLALEPGCLEQQALYRALSVYLNVPSELVIYPGASHGLSKIKELTAKMAWDAAWLDQYVKP